MNEVFLRAITGSLFVISIIASIWYNAIASLIVFFIFFAAGIIEYANLFSKNEYVNFPRKGFLFFGVLFLLIFGVSSVFVSNQNVKQLMQLSFFPLFFAFFLCELWRNKANSIFNITVSSFGFFYIVLPFVLILELVELSDHQNLLLIGMFCLIWTNDTFAYLCGRVIGKTKLFQRISPKKTWEGTLGGVFFTLIVGGFLGYFTNNIFFWLIAALITSPLAILGDLFESLFKRNLEIKDSGSILPGHGGVLDRFDATFFVVPFFYFWVQFHTLFLK